MCFIDKVEWERVWYLYYFLKHIIDKVECGHVWFFIISLSTLLIKWSWSMFGSLSFL